MRMRGLLAVALIPGALLLVATLAAREPISALAPVATLLDGHHELVGVAVAADGTLYVSDRSAGVVYRLELSGTLTMAVTGLDRPAGLALHPTGGLLIAEEKAGRVLRLEPDSTLRVLATGIKTPRWLAVSPDGPIYVSAHRRQPPDGADENEGREILRLGADGSLAVVASGIRRLEGLARLNGALIAATKGFESGRESTGMLLWYPVLADGSLGTPRAWVDTGVKQPVGLVLDWLGALYLAAKEVEIGADKFKRAVGKVHPDARLSAFAAHLEDPQGMALGPDGSLYVADGKAGRLLRFQAPPAPLVNALPAFTNQSPFLVLGTTEPTSRVHIFIDDAPTAVTGTSNASGAFSLEVALAPNATNVLQVFTTTHGGEGLTTTPAEATLIHDNMPPALAILGVSNGATVRGTLQVEVVGTDATSGLHLLELFLDGQPVLSSGEAPLHAVFNGRLLAPGPHTLLARAADRAGNEATKTVQFTVANLTIHLVSPASGSTVPSGPVLVQGTVESPGPEVGVIVNDVVAHVHGGTFATLIPLEPGTATLTILATDSLGATASATGTVTIASGPALPDLQMTPESGLAPLSVEFTASASPGIGATFSLDFGDGSPPHRAATLEGVSHTYVAPGLYFPTLTVTDSMGQVATVKGIVEAHAATTLDALLHSKWHSFRAALGRGDIGAALAHVATSAREKYRRVFEDLGSTLPTVAGQLQDIHLVEVLPGYAGYATYRQRQGDMFLYFIEFVQDADGLWRLENM